MSEATGPATTACPNCGEPVAGEYCAGCGQRQRSYLRALHRIVGEFFGEMLEIDGRVLRSLRLLLLRPGALTREFFADRRASYLTPIRLYLASSLLFFFLLSTTTELDFGWELGGGDVAAELDEEDRQALRKARQRLQAELPESSPVLAELEVLEAVRADAVTAAEAPGDAASAGAPAADAGGAAGPAPAQQSAAGGDWESRLEDRAESFLAEPGDAGAAFLDNLPVAAFVLLPLFALLLKLFYPGHYLVEHLVFSLHLHSFLFLLLGIRLLVPDAVEDDGWETFLGNVRGLLVLGCLVYAGVALKVYFAQSLRRTLVKGGLLLFCYGVLLAVTLLATVVGTVLA